MNEKTLARGARRHGLRARLAPAGCDRRVRTVLIFERGEQAYHWTVDRARTRLAVRH